MNITRPAVAGSLESSDAMVTLTPAPDRLTVEIESVVLEQFGAEIDRAVREVLRDCGVDHAHILINDRGAVECVLKARVETAVRRATEVTG